MEVIKGVFVAENRQYHGLIKIPESENANVEIMLKSS